MIVAIKQFAIDRGWISGPNLPTEKPGKVPVDPITSLANRSTWVIESIKDSVKSLGEQNTEIQKEHEAREAAKNQLIQEQAVLRNIRTVNESVITKATSIFQS